VVRVGAAWGNSPRSARRGMRGSRWTRSTAPALRCRGRADPTAAALRAVARARRLLMRLATTDGRTQMGLFDKLKKAVLKTEDEVLLTEAMLAVCLADGDDQWEETNLVRAFMNTLPELKDKDTYEIYEKAEKNVKLHGALSRVKELGKLGTP